MEQSALLLRDVLGTIRLEPTQGDVGQPYYLAHTSIDCIALLELFATVEAAGVTCGRRRKKLLKSKKL